MRATLTPDPGAVAPSLFCGATVSV